MTPTRRNVLTALAVGATGLAASQVPFSQSMAQTTGFQSLHIKTREISRFKFSGGEAQQFGALLFLGGLELTNSHRNFGGYSGIVSLNQGDKLIAVSDRGHWLRATVSQSPKGKPLKLLDAQTAPMLDDTGKRLKRGSTADTESLSIGGTAAAPRVYVSHEGKGGILSYPLNLTTGEERAKFHLVPREISSLASNKSLESIAVAPANSPLAGALITIAERSKNQSLDRPGWIIGGPTPGKFWIKRDGNFDITDAAFLPNGDLLILERLFSLSEGLAMRLRQLDGSNLRPGHLHTGKTLLTADFSYQIDNMEALSVHQNAYGETVLTLMSDDNQSILQRTLLLRFMLTDNNVHREAFQQGQGAPAPTPRSKPKA